jgi:DnaJ-class molecular chaperone
MHLFSKIIVFLLIICSVKSRSPNLYLTLGLNTSYFDEKELRRAYRRQVLKTHPDKTKGKKLGRNALQTSQEEEFQLVSESYTMLKGKVKNEDTIENVFVNMFDVFTKGKNIIKTIYRTAKVTCRACLGTGGHGGLAPPTLCPTCRGSGHSLMQWGCGHGQPCIQMNSACRTCGGSGFLGQLCKFCRGVGMTTEQREYTVEFPTGSMNHHTLRAVGEGDITNKQQRPGDLLFKLNIKPHQLYELVESTNDLKLTMEMSLEKLRTSFSINIEKLGGPRQGYLTFSVPSYSKMKTGETRTVRIRQFHDYGDLILSMKTKEDIWIFKTTN